MAAEYNVRVSDAERDSVAAQLREHYAQGRLTLDELNQRLELAFASKTRTDLDAVTRDLPYNAPWGALPSDRAAHGSRGGGRAWGSMPSDSPGGWNSPGSGSGWNGPGWGGSGWAGGGRRGSPLAFLRIIPLLAMVGISLIVLSALGFGFGAGPSLWVIVLAAVGALRWLFGRRRGSARSCRGRRRW